MVKRLLVVLVISLFVLSSVSAFAGVTCFQKLADGITGWAVKGAGGEKSHLKEDFPKTFQQGHDYIIRSSPQARKQNLRGNPGELARRRGQ